MNDPRKYSEQNRRAWNEIAEIRGRRWSEKHPIEVLKQAGTISESVRTAAGDVNGKKLLHLQCATGEDSLSWASLGAVVTAVDISDAQIEIAKRRSEEAGLNVRFVAADVYALPRELQEGTFDIVFTGGGVLTWLPALKPWAQAVAGALAPDGIFLLEEEHPLAQALWVERGSIVFGSDYFQRGRPEAESPGWTHFDDKGKATEPKYEFLWPLGDIVTELVSSGLRVERLEEFPIDDQQEWRFRGAMEDARPLPGMFLLVASK